MEAQNTSGPGINKLYVPIGQLHPRSDFAGVLINLNVAAAIKWGKLAFNLTNTFLQNHRERQKIGEFSGQDTGGPPLTRKSLTRFPLPRFLAYVRVSGGISVSRGPQYTNTNFM